MNDVARLGIEVDSSSAAKAVVDLDQLPGAAQRAERGVEGVGRKSTLMGGAVDRATRSIRGMFGAFAAGAAAAMSFNAIISTLSGFEQSMASVAAVTRASSGDLAAMRDIAKQLGATTEFTASQAADGLKFLGMAGFDAQKSIAALPAVLDLATAASMGLADSADITSNIMSAFGVAADGAGAVADVLAAAASRSNTDVYQLGDAMKYAGPVAAALGLDIGKAAAAAGTLSDAGIQGSMAGTGLRRVLSALTNPTNEAAKALQRLGINVNDVNPATKELTDIVDLLRERGLGASEALTIFGDRGGPAILALVENNQKLRELTGIMSDVEGEASRMANTIRDNFAGDLKGLASAAESVIIALGEAGLTGVLRAMTQVATAALRVVAENMDRVLYYAGAVATFFAGPYVAAFVAARIQTFNLVAALTALRGALIRTGVGALVVLAGELVYQFVQLIERAGGFGNAMRQAGQIAQDVWERIKNGGKALDYALRGVAYSVEAAFRAAWGNILVGFENMMSSITGRAPDTFGMTHTPGQTQILEGNRASVQSGIMLDRAAAFWELAMAPRSLLDTDLGPDSLASEWARFNGMGGGGGRGGGGGEGSMGGAAAQLNAYQEATKAVMDNIAALEQQALTFGMTETAAARFNTAMELLSAAQEAGMPITAELIEEINSLAEAYAQAEEQARQLEAAAALFDVPDDPFAVLKEQLAGLDTMLARGQISWEQYGMAAFRANSMAASSVLGLASGMTGALAQMFQDNKAFAVANAVVSTAEAVMKALSIYGPTPWGFAAAGVAAATGAAQISAILSAQKGSASAPRVSSGAATAPAATESQRVTQISVTLQGSGRYSREDLEDMFSQIADGLNNGVDGSERFKVAVAS